MVRPTVSPAAAPFEGVTANPIPGTVRSISTRFIDSVRGLVVSIRVCVTPMKGCDTVRVSAASTAAVTLQPATTHAMATILRVTASASGGIPRQRKPVEVEAMRLRGRGRNRRLPLGDPCFVEHERAN